MIEIKLESCGGMFFFLKSWCCARFGVEVACVDALFHQIVS